MSEEALKTSIQTFFEEYGREQAVAGLQSYQEAVEQTKSALIEFLAEDDRAQRQLSRRAPNWQERFAPRAEAMMGVAGREFTRERFGTQVEQLEGGPRAPVATSLGDQFQSHMNQARLLSGALNNVVHMYYWMENAQLQLENAQNRLLNSQERYTRAVQEYGAGSQQAITAYRQMEVSENRLARAHNREILNMGLLASQAVMLVQRIGTLITAQTAETASVATQTVAYQGLASAKALAMSPMGMLAIGVGAALLFTYAMQQRQQEAETTINRRWAGIPNADVGATVTSPGILSVQKDETILTPSQMGSTGGNNVALSLGDINLTVTKDRAESMIDDMIDQQRFRVKTALRRVYR